MSRWSVLTSGIHVLDAAGVPYWVCNGTLLGLVRDGRLIPWDIDLDIALMSDGDLEIVVPLLIESGFSVYDAGDGSDYVVLEKDGVRFDLNLFREVGDLFQSLWLVPNRTAAGRFIAKFNKFVPPSVVRRFSSQEGYQVPVELVLPLRQQMFAEQVISLPAQPERVLEFVYGSKWRTPQRDFDWRRDGANNASGSEHAR